MEPNYTRWWLESEDEAEDWQGRAEKAEAELAAMRAPCAWTRADDGWFEMSCNGAPYTTRAPKFCPRCGHAVAVVEVQP